MLLFLTLLVSKLCSCESLSSIEMFDVFDETDMEFQPIGNTTDNFYDDARFGGDINIMDNAPPWRENRTDRFNFTDGTLDDNNTKSGLFNTTLADKLMLNNSITDDKHTNKHNNTFANNNTAEISYGNADIRRSSNSSNDASDFLRNDTEYHNGNTSNKTQLNSSTEFSNDNDAANINNSRYNYNDDAQNYDSASNKKPFNNGIFSNSGHGQIRAHIINTTESFTNDKASNNDNAGINRQPIVGYLYNNINANKKGQVNNATEHLNNENTEYENVNANIKTELRNTTELSSNYERIQNVGEYSWMPFTPFANETDSNGYMNITKVNKGTLPAFNIPASPFTCPEDEPPSNIGPYEVPTERDMIIHTKNHLLAMYQGFHTRAMHFLKDVKEATQASWSRKIFCNGPTELMYYRRCVKWVADMSVLTTKSLVTALETIRLDVSTLIQGKICNMSALSVDPVHLLRILAAEKVSLEFALPDFLRQLHACARHCPSVRRSLPEEYLKSGHLTDQDFVIRHYFTQQNYNQQLKRKYKF